MNITQELNNARTNILKALECLNNVETVFGINPVTATTGKATNNPGVITMTTPSKRTLTPAGKKRISAAQKARWAARKANAAGNRVAV